MSILDVFNIKKINEEHTKKMQEQNRAKLEQIAEKRRKQERADIKKYNQQVKETQMQLRRTFTTIAEYKKIAGPKLCRLNDLPEDEREIVIRRVQKLCKEDGNFRKGLMDWARQNYEIPKKEIQKNYPNQNTISI